MRIPRLRMRDAGWGDQLKQHMLKGRQQQMAQMQEVLLADAHEKHYAYSKAKTQMLVIDGTAATKQELQNEADLRAGRPVQDSTGEWPMGTQVSARDGKPMVG